MAKSFYIIDGHAHIYRSYFAPFRDLTSPTGEPTKATYVFTQMLLSLIEQRKPDYLAMVIDKGGGTEPDFRTAIYPEYKANRSSPPEDFAPQEARILQIVKDAGVPIFAKPGVEADDLIATMATKMCDKGWDIYLVSKDKDLRQVLNDCTKMYDVQGDEVIDVKRMEEKVGYTPAEAVEVQTLMGDAIDNVPGIPGVGEKTAVKLVKKYGSADAVLKHLDELTPKMRENFQKYGDKLELSRTLVTLKRDVDFEFNPDECQFTGLNKDLLVQHFRELGFTSLVERMGGGAGGNGATKAQATKAKPAHFEEGLFGPEGQTSAERAAESNLCTSEGCDYTLVDTAEKFEAFLKDLQKQKRFAFDTETDALGSMNSNVIGMSFSWKEGTGYYVPVRGPAGCQHLSCDDVLPKLRPILEDETVGKIGHNIKYDINVMRVAGVEVKGVVLDTMIAAWLIDPTRNQYGIDALARDLLNFQKIATVELIGKGKNQISMDRVELEKVSRYASEDVDVCLRLANLFEDQLKQTPSIQKLATDLEMPLIQVLAEMEFNGIAIDPEILKEQSKALGERIEELRIQIMKEAGTEFNPDSPKQLGDVLFNKLGLKVIKRTKTGPSTDAEVLDRLSTEHPVPKLILEYRSLQKLKNTYLDNLTEYVNPRTKRIHAHFNQTGAETGRLSCSDPNLQNIPIRTDVGRRIRLAFVPGDPKKNVLLTADYSQIELRVLAHFTQEPALMRAFEADEDIHAAVAAEVFGVPLDKVTKAQRGQAKTINFGIIYGVSAFGLARRIDGLTMQAAQDLITAYNKRFPSIERFLQQCVMEAGTKGYVETILGRRRPIPDIHSSILSVRNGAERMAINSVVQGSAADLIKVAMLRIYRRLRDEHRPSKLLLQVHDELVFETPADLVDNEAALVREEMQNAMKLTVPLKVEIGTGKNWQEGK